MDLWLVGESSAPCEPQLLCGSFRSRPSESSFCCSLSVITSLLNSLWIEHLIRSLLCRVLSPQASLCLSLVKSYLKCAVEIRNSPFPVWRFPKSQSKYAAWFLPIWKRPNESRSFKGGISPPRRVTVANVCLSSLKFQLLFLGVTCPREPCRDSSAVRCWRLSMTYEDRAASR